MKTLSHSAASRRSIVLPDSYDTDLDIISDFLKNLGSSGGVSEAIRFSLRKTSQDLKAAAK